METTFNKETALSDAPDRSGARDYFDKQDARLSDLRSEEFRKNITRPIQPEDEAAFNHAFDGQTSSKRPTQWAHPQPGTAREYLANQAIQEKPPFPPLFLTVDEVKLVQDGLVNRLMGGLTLTTKRNAAALIQKIVDQTGVHPA